MPMVRIRASITGTPPLLPILWEKGWATDRVAGLMREGIQIRPDTGPDPREISGTGLIAGGNTGGGLSGGTVASDDLLCTQIGKEFVRRGIPSKLRSMT